MRQQLVSILCWLLLAKSGTAFAPQRITTPFAVSTSRGTMTVSIGLDQENKYQQQQQQQQQGGRSSIFGACCGMFGVVRSTDEDELNAANRRPAKIIICGAPASGKGTQCEIIKEKFGVVHLSTGDMLRAAVAAGTEVGKIAKDYMDNGKLVPDDVIIGVVKERLTQVDCVEKGWLLDGFPRTPAQAKALEDAGVKADCFIFLKVPDEILVERVVGRRTDPVTGKIYHMTFSPPQDEEVLQRLVQRSDDTEEKVKVRLEQFHANVQAVRDTYTDICVVVDGNQPPSRIAEIIVEAIESPAFVKAN